MGVESWRRFQMADISTDYSLAEEVEVQIVLLTSHISITGLKQIRLKEISYVVIA